jgi:hypothetical protein
MAVSPPVPPAKPMNAVFPPTLAGMFTGEATVEPGTPQPLFPVFMVSDPSRGNPFGVEPSRDGQRFLVMQPAAGETAPALQPIIIVTNWQAAGLKK